MRLLCLAWCLLLAAGDRRAEIRARVKQRMQQPKTSLSSKRRDLDDEDEDEDDGPAPRSQPPRERPVRVLVRIQSVDRIFERACVGCRRCSPSGFHVG